MKILKICIKRERQLQEAFDPPRVQRNGRPHGSRARCAVKQPVRYIAYALVLGPAMTPR